MNFQEKLKSLREAAGYKSQKAFADKVGMKYSTYRLYEAQGVMPRGDMLVTFAQILNTSPNDLLDFKPDEFKRCKSVWECQGFVVREIDDDIVISPPRTEEFNGAHAIVAGSKKEFVDMTKGFEQAIFDRSKLALAEMFKRVFKKGQNQ